MFRRSLLALVAAASLVTASPLEARQQATSTSSATPTSTVASTSTSASSNGSFPTDIGYAGKVKQGLQSPFLVQADKINSTAPNLPQAPAPYESRWTAVDDKNGSFNIFKNLGNTSPYFSSPLFPETQANRILADTCNISQVHILHRHGARFPTSSTTEGAPFFGAYIANVTANGTAINGTGPLTFLNDWQYELGAEILTRIGTQQLFDSGVQHNLLYGKLYNASTQAHKPVVRTTSQSRMLDSARYFTLGFFGWNASEAINLEVILEGDGFNNTLASYDTCNNSNIATVGDTLLRPVWDPIYLKDAIQRLQQYTSLNLTTELVYGMQSLCAYETMAFGYSSFCGLFTKEEWLGFEYDLDLQFQGDYGFMNPTGKAQGIGWAQELLGRLTNNTQIAPITTQNSSLLVDPYFPIDQPLYMDFTHDDIIVSVLTALNFTQFADFLDPNNRTEPRNFILSQITPFAARLVFEVIECSNGTANANATQYIRAKIGEAVIPWSADQGCGGQGVVNSTLCPLPDFVRYQQETAVKAASFDQACFGPTPNVTLDTIPRNGTI